MQISRFLFLVEFENYHFHRVAHHVVDVKEKSAAPLRVWRGENWGVGKNRATQKLPQSIYRIVFQLFERVVVITWLR